MEREITHPAPEMTALDREKQIRERIAQICAVTTDVRAKLDRGDTIGSIMVEMDFIGVLLRRLDVIRNEARKAGIRGA